MILSHKNRFIFVKTRKTAGTAIELALRECCGPDDIITPVSPGEELDHRPKRGPQNYLRGDVVRRQRGDGQKKPRPEIDFFHHVTAARLQDMMGKEVWDSYFKFAFVRNPWDQAVSHYFYYRHLTKTMMTFREWLFAVAPIDTAGAITAGGKLALDFAGRYETLTDDFAAALRQAGLPPLVLPQAKTGLRPTGDYRSYYDDASRARVEALNAWIIETFGYRF